ncbi:MAG: GNAT family N-acetyltransferase [Candidatus Gracilibacteria bacterium]
MSEFSKPQLYFLLKKYTPQYLEKEYKKHYVLVYEKGNKILGVGLLIMEDSEIRGLYIDPIHQGEGIGGRIVEELEKEAKRQKMQKVCVKSYFVPEHFYEKMGYRRISEEEIRRGEVSFRFINMEKLLI